MIKDKYNNEEVFVIPFQETLFIDNGFTYTHDKNIWNRFDLIGKYVLRSDAEEKKEIQQIIPYILIKNQFNEFYVSKRLETSTEKRLHNQISIGFGGHINKIDGYTEPLFKCAIRELYEELNIEDNLYPLKHIGYVRDLNGKTNDHIGIVFMTKCLKSKISIKENDYLKGYWMSKNELIDKYGKLESWSKYIVDYMVDSNL